MTSPISQRLPADLSAPSAARAWLAQSTRLDQIRGAEASLLLSDLVTLAIDQTPADEHIEISVDTHPKHAIALGAALAAAQAGGMSGAAGTVSEDAGSDDIAGAAAAGRRFVGDRHAPRRRTRTPARRI